MSKCRHSCDQFVQVHRNFLDKLLGYKSKYRCGCGKVLRLR